MIRRAALVLSVLLVLSAAPARAWYCEVWQTNGHPDNTYHHTCPDGNHGHHGNGYGHYPDSGVYWIDVPIAIRNETMRWKYWMIGWSGVPLTDQMTPLMWPLPAWAQSPGQPPLTYWFYQGNMQLTYFPGMPAYLGLQARKAVGRVWERVWDFGRQGLRYAWGGASVALSWFSKKLEAVVAYFTNGPKYWYWSIAAEASYGLYVLLDFLAEQLPDNTMADYIPALALNNPILCAVDYFLPLSEVVSFLAFGILVAAAYVGLGLFTRFMKVIR